MLGRLPDQLKLTKTRSHLRSSFRPRIARTQPVTVSFGNGGVTVTLRGKAVYQRSSTEPGMNVTAAYKFVKTPEGYRRTARATCRFTVSARCRAPSDHSGKRASIRVLQGKFGKLFARRSSCRASHSTLANSPRPGRSCRRKSSPKTAGWWSAIVARRSLLQPIPQHVEADRQTTLSRLMGYQKSLDQETGLTYPKGLVGCRNIASSLSGVVEWKRKASDGSPDWQISLRRYCPA